jgi:hypothetical protein
VAHLDGDHLAGLELTRADLHHVQRVVVARVPGALRLRPVRKRRGEEEGESGWRTMCSGSSQVCGMAP